MIRGLASNFVRRAAKSLGLIDVGRRPWFLPRTAGVKVNPDTALTFVAAYAAISRISVDVASLPLRLYRRRRRGDGSDLVSDTVLAEALGISPDGVRTSQAFRESLTSHVLTLGNGYAEIERSGDRGEAVGFHLIDPRKVEPFLDPEKKVRYRLTNGASLRPDECLHIAGLGFDGLVGYSPVRLAARSIGIGIAVDQYGASYFENGGRPAGILKIPGELTPERAAAIAERWDAKHAGAENGARIAVLEDGSSFEPISIPPDEAQFLQAKGFQVVEMARLYGLPPHKIGDYSQAHLANIEASNLDYMSATLTQYCVRWEQAINLRVLTREQRRAGFYVKHDLRSFLRGGMRDRAEFYTKMRDLGAYSPNRILELEDENHIEDGDIHLVPLNMVSLKSAGKPDPTKEPKRA